MDCCGHPPRSGRVARGQAHDAGHMCTRSAQGAKWPGVRGWDGEMRRKALPQACPACWPLPCRSRLDACTSHSSILSCSCWMSHCRGSPSLVILVHMPGSHRGIRACIPEKASKRPESTEREHMSGQEGSAPQSLLDLEDTRVRYDTYQFALLLYLLQIPHGLV